MMLKGNKNAFTLAEIMIVALILSIIFAVLAPILTKKMTKDTANPWNWVRPMSQLNAFINRNNAQKPAEVFFGLTPTIGSTPDYEPYSKAIIRSAPWGNTIQKQFHFRYGYVPLQNNSPSNERKNMIERIGEDSGSWLMDTRNILIGGTYQNMLPVGNNVAKHRNTESYYPYNNIALGYMALNSINTYEHIDTNGNDIVTGNNNIAVGYNAGMSSSGIGTNDDSKDNIYIGYNSGKYAPSSQEQTFIGSGAGENNTGSSDTAIGYNAGKNSLHGTPQKTNNVFVGYGAGAGKKLGETSIAYNSTDATVSSEDLSKTSKSVGSVAIGHNALTHIISGNRNIAIGSGALGNLKYGDNNVAIGYNACNGYYYSYNKICIGANSGPQVKDKNENDYVSTATRFFHTYQDPNPYTYKDENNIKRFNYKKVNNIESIYIGSKPDHFGGDAVLEIHNTRDVSPQQNMTDTSIPSSYFGGNYSSSNPGYSKLVYKLNNYPSIVGRKSTTIINGNLIVRGRTFFTVGDYLYNFKRTNDGDYLGSGTKLNTDGKVVEQDVICAVNPLKYTFGDVCKDKFCTETTSSDVACPRVIYNATSDRRLKNIGSKSKSGLAEISKLKVFNYIFKDDESKTPQVGVIAQDLQKIFPKSVMKNKDGFLSIKLDEMFYAAINAIKELDKKIVSLAKKLYKVETTISKLEKENTELKADVENLSIRVQKIKASRGL